MKKKAFYGDNSFIQVSSLQVSAVATFFSEVSQLEHPKTVSVKLSKSLFLQLIST